MGDSTEFAFALCVLATMTDTLGVQLIQPANIPYGLQLGADVTIISLASTITAATKFVSLLWMPLAASRYGRRSVIILSELGSAVGWAVSGLAGTGQEQFGFSASAGISTFLAGRAISGMFSGSSAVLQGAAVELSRDDAGQVNEAKLGARTNTLLAAVYGPGAFLGLAGGALTLIQLNLPYLVAAVVGSLAYVVVLFALHIPTSPPASTKTKGAAAGAGGPGYRSLLDPVLIFEALCYGAANFTHSGLYLLLPAVLLQPSFELLGSSEDPREKLAFNFGLLACCFVVTTLASSVAVAKFVPDRWGAALGFLGALGAGAAVVSLGFADQLWHLFLVAVCGGMSSGMFMPGVMPAIGAYVQRRHSDNKDMAFTIIKLGDSFGIALSHVCLAAILGDELPGPNLRPACIAAAAVLLFGCLGHLWNVMLNMQAPADDETEDVDGPPAVESRAPEDGTAGCSTAAVSVRNSIPESSLEAGQSTREVERARKATRRGTASMWIEGGASMRISRTAAEMCLGPLPPMAHGV